MKIIVLGGDGFCGWPTALKLYASGHDVLILDNLSRREIDVELNSSSLTEIAPIESRIKAAEKVIGKLQNAGTIAFEKCDIRKYSKLKSHVESFKPNTIIHFAEQRAAPYSMISHKERQYTVENNVCGTSSVLNVIVDTDPEIHLVHLGTMGVYGYSKEFGSIPEGYLDIQVKETEQDVSILYPTNPGSVYHMTKSLDQIMFQFYNKNWGIKITDLHQGIVWGTQTTETKLDKRLVNRFDYDGIYGTVLNRFITQAATGNDVSVYGTGGQKRAFIHIEDTANCIRLACENPPTGKAPKVRIFNQVAEVKSVKQLAQYVSRVYDAKVIYIDNPRKEAAENELEVHNEGLTSLGFDPITFKKSLVDDVEALAKQCGHRLNPNNLLTSPRW
jgi:UDP-sulfoquinovose synthase